MTSIFRGEGNWEARARSYGIETNGNCVKSRANNCISPEGGEENRGSKHSLAIRNAGVQGGCT